MHVCVHCNQWQLLGEKVPSLTLKVYETSDFQLFNRTELLFYLENRWITCSLWSGSTAWSDAALFTTYSVLEGTYFWGGQMETMYSQTNVRRSKSDCVEAYYNRTCHFLSSCMLTEHTHTCTQIQRLKANRATSTHQAINTMSKIQLNNAFTSPVNVFSDRMWHHVSMLQKHPSNHTRRQKQHLPEVPSTVMMWLF